MASAASFIDGRLIVFAVSASVAGLVAAFLLGNLEDVVQARVGLLIVLGGAAIIVYNDPNHSPGDYLFTPLLFAIGWLAGYALRQRVAQAEAAEANARSTPSGSARPLHASPLPRSARGSRASFTTSSPTPSA